jgi:hypothetical protein
MVFAALEEKCKKKIQKKLSWSIPLEYNSIDEVYCAVYSGPYQICPDGGKQGRKNGEPAGSQTFEKVVGGDAHKIRYNISWEKHNGYGIESSVDIHEKMCMIHNRERCGYKSKNVNPAVSVMRHT